MLGIEPPPASPSPSSIAGRLAAPDGQHAPDREGARVVGSRRSPGGAGGAGRAERGVHTVDLTGEAAEAVRRALAGTM